LRIIYSGRTSGSILVPDSDNISQPGLEFCGASALNWPGMLPNEQQLSYGKMVLQDSQTLEHYGIKKARFPVPPSPCGLKLQERDGKGLMSTFGSVDATEKI